MRLATPGNRLVLTGRRTARLAEVAAQCVDFGALVHTLSLDVRLRDEVMMQINSLPEAFAHIDVLVNNAGLSQGLDPVHTADLTDWDTMVDTNIKGLAYVTRAIAPQMVQRAKGQIINVSSIAGKEGYPNGNMYVATKHAIEGFTRAVRADLAPHGIRVGTISPGMVDTEFSVVRFHGDAERAANVYQNMHPLYAQDIANAIHYMIAQPDHVNIADIFILPTAQASATQVTRNS